MISEYDGLNSHKFSYLLKFVKFPVMLHCMWPCADTCTFMAIMTKFKTVGPGLAQLVERLAHRGYSPEEH